MLTQGWPHVQTLFLLGTFAATFIARPIGGVVFGWLGDKVGRQKVPAATLMLMAASTFAVGLLPGYAQIGVWAAALMVLLKLVQGFSTGGEYAGATTFVCEYAPDKRRGFFASFLDMGSYVGFALGAGSGAKTEPAFVQLAPPWERTHQRAGRVHEAPFASGERGHVVPLVFRVNQQGSAYATECVSSQSLSRT